MKIRREFVMAGAAVHLVIAALFSTHVQIEKLLPAAIERPLRNYGAYTGASTHFNFFAPAVPSQPRVIYDLTLPDGSRRRDELRTPSAEVNQRIANMQAVYELAAFRPLLLRSWAIYMLARHPDAVSVELRVEILRIPRLDEIAKGASPAWVEVERMTLRRDELS